MSPTPVAGPSTALLTGATDGIGKAVALHLLRRGWAVTLVGRSPARCADTVAALRAAVPGAQVDAIVADLSSLAAVRELAQTARSRLGRLDLLLLNANAITQTHTLTPEGFEANLALGYLGRVLLSEALEPLLAATPGAQVLSVVGMDHSPLDLADPHFHQGFSARKALWRWQWAAQVYVRESNRRGLTRANVYMPGLVRTKILASEPQPMRLIVQIANALVGISVERSAEELCAVVEMVAAQGLADVYFNRTKACPPRDLKTRPEDGQRLWDWTAATLAPFRPAGD